MAAHSRACPRRFAPSPVAHLVISCCLLDLPMFAPPCRPAACVVVIVPPCCPVVISSRPVSRPAVVPSSYFLGLLFAWTVGAISSVISSVIPSARSSSRRHLRRFCLLAACRLVLRLVSVPFSSGDVIAALPNRSPCRPVCCHLSPRPACRIAGRRTGRVASFAIACPPCRRCLLTRGVWAAAVLPVAAACLLARSALAVCAGIVMAELYI